MIIETSEVAISKLIGLLDNRYKSKQVLIVCGKTNSKKIAEVISAKTTSRNIINVVDDTVESIQSISELVDNYSVILGVGGGKLMDISKEIAFQNNLDLILFPTVISNDGLANGLVVLNSVNKGKSVYRKSADYIFIDYSIINSAPDIYLKSAIGDVFSNYSAINDFIVNHNKVNEVSEEVKHLVLESLEVLIGSNKPNVDRVVEAIVISGKAVEVLTNSSAISGSEHLILHSIEKLHPTKKITHGCAVASISLFTLHLQGKLDVEHISFLKHNFISNNFIELFNLSCEELFEVFEVSKGYRPSRKTVLNSYGSKQLVEQIKLFEKTIKTT